MPSDVHGDPLAAPPSHMRPPLTAGDSFGDSTEPSVAQEHDEDDDRDELDEEVEDAASSEGRARSPEADVAPVAPALDPISAAASEAARNTVLPNGGKTQAAFVHKVWSMVETPALQNLISWSSDGKTFLVYSPEEFARTVLPQFFKHSNFASFLRQLNFYSWSKVNDILGSNASATKPDGTPVQAWEFRNPNFQRGRPDLLARIKRKTAKASATASATASPAPTRRRSSVTALSSLRASRRDGGFGSTSDASQSVEERDAEGSSSSLLATESATAGPPPVRPPTREDHAGPPKRIAAGLADFAPYGGDAASPGAPARAKEEIDYRPSLGLVSPTYARHPPPPPIQPTAYVPPHQFSPGTRSYGLPPPSLHSSYRHSYTEEPLARQVSVLEGQVRSLSDALHFSQQEFVAMRTTSYSVLQSVLGIVSNLDSEGRQRDEVQAATAALARLSPEASPGYPYPNPFAYSTGLAWPPTHAFPSPRPSTAQSTSQFYYNRISAAESYTRSSRPDSRPDPSAPPASRPATSADVRSSAPTLPSPRPPTASAVHEAPKPVPPVLPPPHPSTRPRSAGPGPPAAYPPPRSSWASQPDGNVADGAAAPSSMSSGVGHEGKGTTTLPPLSSLLNPSTGPAPPHSFADERRVFDACDDADERARKKQRQQH